MNSSERRVEVRQCHSSFSRFMCLASAKGETFREFKSNATNLSAFFSSLQSQRLQSLTLLSSSQSTKIDRKKSQKFAHLILFCFYLLCTARKIAEKSNEIEYLLYLTVRFNLVFSISLVWFASVANTLISTQRGDFRFKPVRENIVFRLCVGVIIRI